MLKFLTDLFKPEAPKAQPITSETSMSFASIEVAPFLTQLTNNPRFGLPANFAASIADGIPSMALDETLRWKIEGGFDGALVELEIEVFMNGTDAPDLTFFSSQAAIEEIERELTIFAAAMEG
ncbi:hypothetical protein [Leisingera sp. ANG-Vp]|uniref:hypothetical protein n=1 Tax=Leisingera sp. ANG-Vp TaxID=1577896 RepID=UPI00057FF8DF|nr:hypothetical protein [Leisingera sp. ANG-Vp]KIC20245.1 hypothetical protein RA20_09610 [Leisingera sp. ANG-Vp]